MSVAAAVTTPFGRPKKKPAPAGDVQQASIPTLVNGSPFPAAAVTTNPWAAAFQTAKLTGRMGRLVPRLRLITAGLLPFATIQSRAWMMMDTNVRPSQESTLTPKTGAPGATPTEY